MIPARRTLNTPDNQQMMCRTTTQNTCREKAQRLGDAVYDAKACENDMQLCSVLSQPVDKHSTYLGKHRNACMCNR